jgi:hypothetical protein
MVLCTKNKCTYSKTYDQNSLYQVIVDMIYVDCEQMWRDQFMDHDQLPERLESKRRKLSTTNDYAEQIGFHDIFNAIDKYVSFSSFWHINIYSCIPFSLVFLWIYAI